MIPIIDLCVVSSRVFYQLRHQGTWRSQLQKGSQLCLRKLKIIPNSYLVCSEEDKYKFICSCSYSIQQLTLQSRSNHSIQHHSLLINTSRQNNRHTVQTTEYKDSDRDDDIIKLHTITTSSGKHMLHPPFPCTKGYAACLLNVPQTLQIALVDL